MIAVGSSFGVELLDHVQDFRPVPAALHCGHPPLGPVFVVQRRSMTVWTNSFIRTRIGVVSRPVSAQRPVKLDQLSPPPG